MHTCLRKGNKDNFTQYTVKVNIKQITMFKYNSITYVYTYSILLVKMKGHDLEISCLSS